ncbi:MAG: RNA 2',3'-cyclic phosphodiesterase [Pseudomonadota bacterium]
MESEAAERILDIQTGLDGVRWTPFDNLHLTLCFLGGVDRHLLEDVDTILTGIKIPAFDLELSGSGSFGRGPRQSVWVGTSRSPNLLQLQEKVENACRRAGASVENRKFVPHVTVGRMGRVSQEAVTGWVSRHSLFKATPFTVETFHLYESTLSKSGAHYEPIADYPLSFSR